MLQKGPAPTQLRGPDQLPPLHDDLVGRRSGEAGWLRCARRERSYRSARGRGHLQAEQRESLEANYKWAEAKGWKRVIGHGH